MNRKLIYLMIPIITGLILFIHCRKDFSEGQGMLDQSHLNPRTLTNVQISFKANKVTYKSYVNPIDTINSPAKVISTLPLTETYDVTLNLNANGFNFVTDHIQKTSSVDTWNSKAGDVYKVINDGIHLTCYDINGIQLSQNTATSSGLTPNEILGNLAVLNDTRPIAQKIQELINLGADVTDTNSMYVVITSIQNPNFNQNSVTVFSKTDGKVYNRTLFLDNDNTKISSFQLTRYDMLRNPIELYQEEYEYLADGDIEKSTTITTYSDGVYIIN